MPRNPKYGPETRIKIKNMKGKLINVCRLCRTPNKHKFNCPFSHAEDHSRIAYGKKLCETLVQQQLHRSNIHMANRAQSIAEAPSNIDGTPDVNISKFQHIEVEWNKMRSKFPNLYKWSIVERDKGQRLLKEFRGSISFKSEDPIGVCRGKCGETINNYDFSTPPVDVHVVCYHLFFPTLMDGKAISCPNCGTSRDVSLDGWTKSFRICHQVGSYSLIKARRYKCTNDFHKQNGKTGFHFTAMDSTVMSTLPPIVRNCIPFVILGRGIYHVDLVSYIRESRMAGTSFSAMEQCLRNMMARKSKLNMLAYLELIETIIATNRVRRQNQPGLTIKDPVVNIDQFEINAVIGPTRRRLTQLYVEELIRLEPHLVADMVNIKATVLKTDHTFKLCKSVRSYGSKLPSYYGAVHIMNEVGEICAFYYTYTKSFEELTKEFELFRDRVRRLEGKVERIYIDNPDTAGMFFKRIFGDDVEICYDIFHIMDDFHRLLAKNDPQRNEYMSKLSDIFFVVDENDLVKVQAQLSAKYGQDYVNNLPGYAYKKMKEVRTYVNDKDAIEENLIQLLQEYNCDLNKRSVYNDRYSSTEIRKFFEKQIGLIQSQYFQQNVLKRIESEHDDVLQPVEEPDDDGYDDPHDDSAEHNDNDDEPHNLIPIHINVGTDDNPKYITSRSTSQLESAHLYARNGIGGWSTGEKLFHLLNSDKIYRWNINNRKKRSLKKLKKGTCYDPVLVNDISALLNKLNMEVSNTMRLYGPLAHKSIPEPFIDETFGAIRFHYSASWFQVSSKIEKPERFCTWVQQRMLSEVLPRHIVSKEESNRLWRIIRAQVNHMDKLNDVTDVRESCKFLVCHDDEKSLQVVGMTPSWFARVAAEWNKAVYDALLIDDENLSIFPKTTWHLQIFVKKEVLKIWRLARIRSSVGPSNLSLMVGLPRDKSTVPATSINTRGNCVQNEYATHPPMNIGSTVQLNSTEVPFITPTSNTTESSSHIESRSRIRRELPTCFECNYKSNTKHHKLMCAFQTFQIQRKREHSSGDIIIVRPVDSNGNLRSIYAALQEEWRELDDESKSRFRLRHHEASRRV